MRLLAIETSSQVASVALCGDGCRREMRFPAARHLCETLAPRIAQLIRDEAIRPDAIAVGLGPGSFTGLRIGVATAKALAHAWDVPLVGRCSLEVAAAPIVAAGARCMPVAYARRGWVYLAIYEAGEDGTLVAAVEPQVASIDQARQVLVRAAKDRPIVICGFGTLLSQVVGEEKDGRISVLQGWYPSAGVLARLAERDVAAADANNKFSLRPMYLLPSQAERMKGIDLGMSR